ncbi:MAG: monovalent cation/H+ antiporter complex subunit F [Nitrososphaerota archaeon]|nr:monovalent cation/H+ antiporter complex subunit F [Nitrososphaerales archaeon]MDW8044495.1 monovalent cation/H+ antiporter complex subunit F [Nitrososphaerota archaeon]
MISRRGFALFETIIDMLVPSVIPIFIASFSLYTIRIIKGPTIPDMVLGVSCLSINLIFLMVLLAVYFRSLVLIPCAFMLLLWTFILDIFMAKYLERRELSG